MSTTSPPTWDTLHEAQQKITEILNQLEEATGSWVESVDIKKINVTTRDEVVSRYLRSVHINLEPKDKYPPFGS